MIGKSVLLLPLCLVSVCRGSRFSSSEVECTSNNKACSLNDGNLIDALGDIPGPEECHWLCLNQDECDYFTYYPRDSFPYSGVCFMFYSCYNSEPCENCMSRPRNCHIPLTCSYSSIGSISGDNLLDTVDYPYYTDTESKCKDRCLSTPFCSYYTLITPNPYNSLCHLLSSLQEPIRPCENCVTGPVYCSNHDYRKL